MGVPGREDAEGDDKEALERCWHAPEVTLGEAPTFLRGPCQRRKIGRGGFP